MEIKTKNWSISIGKNQVAEKEKLNDRRPFVMSTDIKYSDYKLSFDSLFYIYRHNSDVRNCVRELRQNVGANGWALEDINDPEATINPQDIARVSSTLGRLDFWYNLRQRIVRDFAVAGNVYLYKVKNASGNAIIALQVIDPRTVGIISTKQGEIIKYVQKIRNGTQVATIDFLPEEIIHIKDDADVTNEVFGAASLEPVLWEAKTDLAAMMSNYFFFENHAMPSHHIILDEDLSEEQAKKAEELFKDEFKGVKNKHKGSILKGVKEIKTLQFTQKEMEFLQGRKFVTEKICAAFGVPRFMLGYTETVNNNNGTELTRNFFVNTIEPLEQKIAEVFTRDLLPSLGIEGKKFIFPARSLIEQSEIERRALEEYQKGAITLRQYKIKTGQQITAEDEATPNFDSYIIHQGGSAVTLEDVGVDPVIDPSNEQNTNKLIKALNGCIPNYQED